MHEYEHDRNAKSFGLEAADKLGLDVTEVFKTLLVSDDKHFFVAILPVHHQLNLKKVAAAFQCKKMHFVAKYYPPLPLGSIWVKHFWQNS